MDFNYNQDPITSAMMSALLVQSLEKVWAAVPSEHRATLYEQIDALVSEAVEANKASASAVAGAETVRGIIQRLG